MNIDINQKIALKKQVAAQAKEMQNALFGGTNKWGGSCNECKQTAFRGMPSIRVTDGMDMEWWNANVETVKAFEKKFNGQLMLENFTRWDGKVLIKARIAFPQFYC